MTYNRVALFVLAQVFTILATSLLHPCCRQPPTSLAGTREGGGLALGAGWGISAHHLHCRLCGDSGPGSRRDLKCRRVTVSQGHSGRQVPAPAPAAFPNLCLRSCPGAGSLATEDWAQGGSVGFSRPASATDLMLGGGDTHLCPVSVGIRDSLDKMDTRI